MKAKRSLKVRLFVLLILLSGDVTGTKGTEEPTQPKAAVGFTLDNYDTDTVLTLAMVALAFVIALLSLYVLLGFWGALGDYVRDPPTGEAGEQYLALQERRDREFMETFPKLIGIVVACIVVREVIFVCADELPLIGKIPEKHSLRAYGISVLIHCTPVSIFLIYKLVPVLYSTIEAIRDNFGDFFPPAYTVIKFILFGGCFLGEIYTIFCKPREDGEGNDIFILFVCVLPITMGLMRSMHRLTAIQRDVFWLTIGVMTSRIAKEVLFRIGVALKADDSFRELTFGYVLLSFLLASSIALSYDSIKYVFFTRGEPFGRKLKQVMFLNIVFLSSNMGTDLINQHFCLSCASPGKVEETTAGVQMAQLLCTSIYVCVVLANLFTSRLFQRNFFGSLLLIFVANLLVFFTNAFAGVYVEYVKDRARAVLTSASA